MKPVEKRRKRVKETTLSKEYRILTNPAICEPYYEEGWTWNHPGMPNHLWRRYRTWKYSRKTQYKQKKHLGASF
jgi:hypothetical protein